MILPMPLERSLYGNFYGVKRKRCRNTPCIIIIETCGRAAAPAAAIQVAVILGAAAALVVVEQVLTGNAMDQLW